MAGDAASQQRSIISPEGDSFSCAPPYGPATDTPGFSRYDSVEREVAAGATANLCLMRASTVVVGGLRCRRTDSEGDFARSWTCPMGALCDNGGAFLGGARSQTLDAERSNFCVRYLNAGENSQTVRVDFVFSHPAR
jgi:hypothetical protein